MTLKVSQTTRQTAAVSRKSSTAGSSRKLVIKGQVPHADKVTLLLDGAETDEDAHRMVKEFLHGVLPQISGAVVEDADTPPYPRSYNEISEEVSEQLSEGFKKHRAESNENDLHNMLEGAFNDMERKAIEADIALEELDARGQGHTVGKNARLQLRNMRWLVLRFI